MHGIARTTSTFRAAWLAAALATAGAYPSAAAARPNFDLHDTFGTAVALGDFNGDGRDELVVGDPGATVSPNITEAGAIRVYNSLPGSTAYHTITLATSGIPGSPQGADHFGRALAVGDFDRDGLDDLAVGAPGRVDSGDDTGTVYVIYGRSTGLQTFNRVTTHGPPAAEENAPGSPGRYGFGWSLAVGDFGGDAADDLAIGMPGRVVSSKVFAGAIFIRYGAIDVGTSSLNGQIWHQDLGGIPGAASLNYMFGYALAAGELGHSATKDDLAIGIPGHIVNGAEEAGTVIVMFGTNTVLGTANLQHIHQDWGSAHGTAELGDAFGTALTAGGFDGDSYDDLVIGVADEDVDGYVDAGFVNIMYGSSAGISSTRQASLALNGPQADELGDYEHYGRALTVGDFNDNGFDDLAVGAPRDTDQSSVTVYYSSSSGVSNTNYQYWTSGAVQDYIGGESLAAGDFDEDGVTDLVSGYGSVLGLEGRSPGGLTAAAGFSVDE